MVKNSALQSSASPPLLRKAIHFFTGILIFVLTYWVDKSTMLWLILAGSVFAFLTFPYNTFYLLHKTAGPSLGTLFYPLGILSAFLLLYPMHMNYFRVTLLILSVSDTVANLIGQIQSGNGWFRILKDQKSMHGIAGYIVASLAIFFLFLPLPMLTNVYLVFFLILLAVALEIVSWRGSDNFSIPFGLAAFFYLTERFPADYIYLSGVVIFMSIGVFLLFRYKLLTRYGSFAAWCLGLYLLMGPGYRWIIPVLAFFISSVLFTKIRAVVRGKKKKSIGRNAWQVIANILWAVISSVLYLLTKEQLFADLFIVYVAAVTSDTWASEIGPVFNKRSFSIADRKMHEAGFTGGISPAGTVAALAGAVSIALLGYATLFGELHLNRIIIISISAFMASFSDTLMGAFWENKLSRKSWFINHQDRESITPNDIVNLAGSLTAGLFYMAFILLLMD